MMMMMNCFCGIVDRRKVLSLISNRGHCQRSSPSRISDTPLAGFEPAQNLSFGFVEWSCAVVITTTPRRQHPSVWFTTVNQRTNSYFNKFVFMYWSVIYFPVQYCNGISSSFLTSSKMSSSDHICKYKFKILSYSTLWMWNMALSTCEWWSSSTSNWTVFLGKII